MSAHHSRASVSSAEYSEGYEVAPVFYKTELLNTFSRMQKAQGYPRDKLSHLACPFWKFYPEKYRHVRSSACVAWGFKDIGELNEHIERAHCKKSSKSSRSGQKDIVPVQMSSAREEKWRNKKGKKGGSAEEKWWQIFKAVHDCRISTEERPPQFHLHFPGPDILVLDRYLSWNQSPSSSSDNFSASSHSANYSSSASPPQWDSSQSSDDYRSWEGSNAMNLVEGSGQYPDMGGYGAGGSPGNSANYPMHVTRQSTFNIATEPQGQWAGDSDVYPREYEQMFPEKAYNADGDGDSDVGMEGNHCGNTWMGYGDVSDDLYRRT